MQFSLLYADCGLDRGGGTFRKYHGLLDALVL
jgi:hypothetical protein